MAGFLFYLTVLVVILYNTKTLAHAQDFSSSTTAPRSWKFNRSRDDQKQDAPALKITRSLDSESSFDKKNTVWYPFGFGDGDAVALDLTRNTGLVLRDAEGHTVWSATGQGQSVSSMNLTCQGNLVLLNNNGGVIWQSFDHPADTWLQGQSLSVGQRLTSRVSSDNFSAGNFYVLVGNDTLHAFVSTADDQPKLYGRVSDYEFNPYLYRSDKSKVEFVGHRGDDNYLQLAPDGHLYCRGCHFYDDLYNDKFSEVGVLDVAGKSNCGYPTACGSYYGVCYEDGDDTHTICDCPDYAENGNVHHFRQVDPSKPQLGCSPIIPLSCDPDARKLHTFIRLEKVSYLIFDSHLPGVHNIDSCLAICLENCSCKAAFFHYKDDVSFGNCSISTELLTLGHLQEDSFVNNFIAFVKVQKPAEKAAKSSLVPKVVPAVTVSLFIVLSIGIGFYLRRKFASKKTQVSSDVVIDMVTRFSFESLKLATEDFQQRLGRGGFGAVFEGNLEDGRKVAVKRLESVGQGRKEFLAEVNTIGNLHHYNLVRLIGFCDDGLNRVLVYEFMPNGSLDKWIFKQHLAQTLTWSMRQRIISGIAKGLEYLHENCLQNVIHFDIKPQNILLDSDFNVKISDFGLAKMVDRDQSQVITIIKGTPGYIAPELITAQVISVKVDVYSFGVLVLEIVCGRKNAGSAEDDVLIDLVKVKADEDRLSDLIDNRVEDMQQHKEEAVKMMKIAIWCLQPHFIRPNMSMVVKVLQDSPNMDTLSDLSFLNMVHDATTTHQNAAFSSCPTESLLSGPR